MLKEELHHLRRLFEKPTVYFPLCLSLLLTSSELHSLNNDMHFFKVYMPTYDAVEAHFTRFQLFAEYLEIFIVVVAGSNTAENLLRL